MNLGGIDFNISGAMDFLLKLALAASIIAAIIAAGITFRNNRRLNAQRIAKNHYREMLELFLRNSDVLYLGANRDSYSRLKAGSPSLSSVQDAIHRDVLRYAGAIPRNGFETREELGANDTRVHFIFQMVYHFGD